jgi:hypothetical protein
MISAFTRKARRLADDPVLRAWMIGRVLGRNPSPPSSPAHRPPYAQGHLPLKLADQYQLAGASAAKTDPAPRSITVPLSGSSLTFDPVQPDRFYTHPLADIEVDLARHRFAWLPLVGSVPDGVFAVAWTSWRRLFHDREGVHWHPYTTAERAINVIDAMARLGAPADPQQLASDLAHHAKVISERLEYFGNHDTSNHLANNGRGLYRIGCALNDNAIRCLGLEILGRESGRIILPSGVLREGSSHYHMLYLRNYLDVWLCAEVHGHAEDARTFKNVAQHMISVGKALVLAGGLPLIGDISPDVPPEYLAGIEQGRGVWVASRSANEQRMIQSLVADTPEVAHDRLLADGWLRWEDGRWSALANVPALGWPFMPGHAHQDMGSAEIHLDGAPLFIDPGRGLYGEDKSAAEYRTGSVHGTLLIDGLDPYPANKPYYSKAFRTRIAGPAVANTQADGFTIRHGGYQRLHVDTVRRRWRFNNNGFRIDDAVTGHGTHEIERALVTPLAVRIDNERVIIDERFSLRANGLVPECHPVTAWHAYGSGNPATRIVFRTTDELPWIGAMIVEEII